MHGSNSRLGCHTGSFDQCICHVHSSAVASLYTGGPQAGSGSQRLGPASRDHHLAQTPFLLPPGQSVRLTLYIQPPAQSGRLEADYLCPLKLSTHPSISIEFHMSNVRERAENIESFTTRPCSRDPAKSVSPADVSAGDDAPFAVT